MFTASPFRGFHRMFASVMVLAFLALLSVGCGSKAVKNARDYLRVEEYGRAREVLELEVELRPTNLEAYVLLGEVNLFDGEIPRAEEAFRKAILLDEGSREEVAEIYFNAAQRLVQDTDSPRQLEYLLGHLKQSINYNPDMRKEISQWALDTGRRYLEADLPEIAFDFAIAAGDYLLKPAAELLKDVALQLDFSSEKEKVREAVRQALEWNSDLANDKDLEPTIALLAPGGEHLVWLKETKPVLDAKRAEHREIQDRLAGKIHKESEAHGGEAEANLVNQRLELKAETISSEILKLAGQVSERAVAYLNAVQLASDGERTPDQKFVIDIKTFEDMLIAQEYINKGGNYSRALDIYRMSQQLAPDHPGLLAAIASAEELRYMSEERFGKIRDGMTMARVRELLGQVMSSNVRDFGDLVGWFYRKTDGGAAAVYFKEADGKKVVYGADFNAVKP